MSSCFVARTVLAGTLLASCSLAGVTVRLDRPHLRGADLAPGRATSPTGMRPGLETASVPRRAEATTVPGVPMVTPGADDLLTVVDPDGRFSLRHGDTWHETEPATDTATVDWLLRLERGEPGAPVPAGAKVPPDGARFELAVASLEVGADLAAWAARELPLDPERFSTTADAMAGVIGPDQLGAVFREGQILPYYGRWREWIVPSPSSPGQVYVVRVQAYGIDDQWEMAHAKIVASTVRLR